MSWKRGLWPDGHAYRANGDGDKCEDFGRVFAHQLGHGSCRGALVWVGAFLQINSPTRVADIVIPPHISSAPSWPSISFNTMTDKATTTKTRKGRTSFGQIRATTRLSEVEEEKRKPVTRMTTKGGDDDEEANTESINIQIVPIQELWEPFFRPSASYAPLEKVCKPTNQPSSAPSASAEWLRRQTHVLWDTLGNMLSYCTICVDPLPWKLMQILFNLC